MTISAQLLAHSAYVAGKQLHTIATLELRYPRFVHAEFMTHRDFSRSASSSRAVPIRKIIAQVEADPAYPEEWGSKLAGMQAGPEILDVEAARLEWKQAANENIFRAKRLADLGLHKQVVNRILEPYSHISVVVTATQWDNFFTLRCNKAADPTMRAIAEAIRNAIRGDAPRLLGPGDWHMPYVAGGTSQNPEDALESAAMCARVSFLRHDGERPSGEENRALAARLLSEGHMSPFEHQARPAKGRFANFHGWRSFRFDIENPESRYWSPFKKYTPNQKVECVIEDRPNLAVVEFPIERKTK